MKRKDTSYEWAENGTMVNYDIAKQKVGYINLNKAYAGEVNFPINKLDDFLNDVNNEMFNVLDSVDITPDESNSSQLLEAIDSIISYKTYKGGVIKNNSTSPTTIVDISALKCRSEDDSGNINIPSSSLNINTSTNWANGAVPTLINLIVYVWATSTNKRAYFDDSTGSNITGAKALVGYFDLNDTGEVQENTQSYINGNTVYSYVNGILREDLRENIV